jgi:Ca2+/Na+ antiporter
MLISYLAFFIHPSELEARIGIGVAGIFGAVTSQSVVSDNLPEISYITLSDKIHISSLLFIFFVLLVSCLHGYLCRREREQLAERIDTIMSIVMTLGYVVTVALFILLR